MPSLTVFLCTGRVPLRLAWRHYLRRPRLLYYPLVGVMVRTFTWSPLAHVAIGDNHHVFNPTISGHRVWPIDTVLARYPSLKHAYIVFVPRPIQVSHLSICLSPRASLSILKWLTNGRVDTDDCVCAVKRVLADAGIDIPKSVYSPARLDRWLARRFERAEL